MKKTIWIPAVVATVVAAVVIAILVAIPIVAERSVENWLREQGVVDPSVGNIDFNAFTGDLVVESLSFAEPSGRRGTISLVEADVQMAQLPARKLLLSFVGLSDVRVDIERTVDGAITVGGLRLLLAARDSPQEDGAEAAESTWDIGLDEVFIDDASFTFRDEPFDNELRIDELTIRNFASWEPERALELEGSLQVDDARSWLQVEATPLAPMPAVKAKIQVEKLALHKFAAILTDLGLTETQGSLSVELEVDASLGSDDTVDVIAGGNVTLEKFSAMLPEAIVQVERSAWLGEFTTTLSSTGSHAPVVAGTSEVRIESLGISDPAQTIQLLQLGNLLLEDVSVTDQSVVKIGKVLLDSLNVQLRRNADGEFVLISELLTPSDEDAEEEETGTQSEFEFQVANAQIRGSSMIDFSDAAVDPVFAGRIAIENLEVSDFGNHETDRPASVAIELEQDGATVSVEGTLQPFADKPAAEAKVIARNVDLTTISSYMPDYHVERGRLSLDSDVTLDVDAIDARNSVVIEKLKLSGKAGADPSPLDEGLAMPLDVALDLLRDKDDRIVLELPITGSWNELELGTGDIVRVATGKAIQKAALSYVTKSLQPLGTIMFVAKVAGKAARPRFEPVEFAAGSSELTEEAIAYLDKIVALLDERPSLSITFCGVSTTQDLEYLAGQLPPTTASAATETSPEQPGFETERLEIAQARGAAVQEYLAARHGIDPERLFRCRPTVEAESDAMPRVEITL